MSIKPTKAKASAAHAAAASAPLFRGQSYSDTGEPDFVTRIFDLLVEAAPELSAKRAELEPTLRTYMRGERGTVTTRPSTDVVAQRVLALFNGRNPREVARKLGISRASVYRHLKQAGGVKAHNP